MIIDLRHLSVSPYGRVELNDEMLAQIETSFVPTAGGSTNTGKCVNSGNCGSSTNQTDCRNMTTCEGADNKMQCENYMGNGPLEP